ncbi:MAG TPA: hypothetical protein IGS40_09770 [Trichormus sp. M33_DOE_039]|nr:hypothetical protein [Trichormus sp. M33_DOE_039]
MGLFQWLILRPTLRQSFWWTPANAVIMLVAPLRVLNLGYISVAETTKQQSSCI